MLKLVLQISRGLIHQQQARRTVMFYALVAALVLLFLGATLLYAPLRARPLLFLAYWAACAWLTLAAMGLAFFDMLLLRAAARAARRKLEAETFSAVHPAPNPSPDDPHAR